MVPLLQVQLVQAFAFQESPFSSTSPSLVMQYSCSLLLTGSSGLSSVDAHRYSMKMCLTPVLLTDGLRGPSGVL